MATEATATGKTRPALLYIVSRRQPELHAYLSRQFASEPDMLVVLDRRRGERRRSAAPPPGVERRQADRRRDLEVAHQLLTMGYAFARPAREEPPA